MSKNVWKQKTPKRVEVVQRQNLVRRLLAREIPRESILQALEKQGHKINHKTLARDIEDIQEETWNEISRKKEPMENLLTGFLIRYNETSREMWDLYAKTSEDRVKARCLENISRMLGEKVKVLQSLGIVRIAPIQPEGGVTVRKALELIRQVNEELAAKKEQESE